MNIAIRQQTSTLRTLSMSRMPIFWPPLRRVFDGRVEGRLRFLRGFAHPEVHRDRADQAGNAGEIERFTPAVRFRNHRQQCGREALA